ncbi:hypothetical protein FQY83_05095 [Luteimonas marina]|uniref:Uncharacterized protein n=1 Tax=Luteimonas marina TaxID=488485 RepID=A0A5C5U923_9GAMM|nr:hypothetical protein [Luteimonas marina]TWT22408.1 hypothetical protein FQY83_05095 [Luteimonas marina]
MPNLIAPLVTALLLAVSKPALACSIFPEDPARIFKDSDSVVLAEPLEISPGAEEIERPKENYSYQQTVTWQVIKVWKGNFTIGETFATTSWISTSDPCSGWNVVRDHQPQILRSVADSSFQLYYAAPVAWASPQLDALKEDHNGQALDDDT